MIYIEIPEGMEYRGATRTEHEQEDDRFVANYATNHLEAVKDNFLPKSIQKAVYEFYQSHKDQGEVDGLRLYKRKPASTQKPLLVYRAIRNGLEPTNFIEHLYASSSAQKSRGPGRWINHTLLSPERHEIAKRKEEEQKYNRRKWGDSPSAN